MSQNETAAAMAATWWTDRLEQGDKQAFHQFVYEQTLAELNERGQSKAYCDYDPWGWLLGAVHAAGLKCRGCMFSADGILPRKTGLHVFPDHLEPKEGYGNWTDHIPVPNQEPQEQGGESGE